jgi:hypothetical protein
MMLEKEKYGMKQPKKQVDGGTPDPLSRRKLFAAATGLGAAAAAATLIPRAATQASALPVAKAAPLKGGGYTLSEHVKQYYKSALI